MLQRRKLSIFLSFFLALMKLTFLRRVYRRFDWIIFFSEAGNVTADWIIFADNFSDYQNRQHIHSNINWMSLVRGRQTKKDIIRWLAAHTEWNVLINISNLLSYCQLLAQFFHSFDYVKLYHFTNVDTNVNKIIDWNGSRKYRFKKSDFIAKILFNIFLNREINKLFNGLSLKILCLFFKVLFDLKVQPYKRINWNGPDKYHFLKSGFIAKTFFNIFLNR